MMKVSTGSRPNSDATPRSWVECKACGEVWHDGDPALLVACPKCPALPGERCWISPRSCGACHIARDVAAMSVGLMDECAALTWDRRHSRHLVRACSAVSTRVAA